MTTPEKKEKKSVGRKFKETSSELKKISWPSFGTVVKKTLVVIGMVIFFTIVLWGIDYLLGLLYNLLISNIK